MFSVSTQTSGDVPPGPFDPDPAAVPPSEPAPGRTSWYRRAAMSRWAPLAVAGVAVAGCAYAAIVDPNTSSAYPQCTFHQVTGLDCPGCGLTRGVHALITGQPLRALDHNILLLVIVPLALYAYLQWAGAAWFNWRLPPLRFPRWSGYAFLAVVVTFWVARNLSWGPLPWLAATA